MDRKSVLAVHEVVAIEKLKSALSLRTSPGETLTESGIRFLIREAIRRQNWSEKNFHDQGIPVGTLYRAVLAIKGGRHYDLVPNAFERLRAVAD